MQPVANLDVLDRSPADLMRLIADDRLVPASVSSEEERRLMAVFRLRERKLLAKIGAQVSNGAVRAAWRTSTQLRHSMAGRYLALWRSKPRNLVDRTGQPAMERDAVRAERVRQILALLPRVGDLTEQAAATVYAKRKDRNRAYRYLDAPQPSLTSSGAVSRRVIFEFGWVDKARQRLLARGLTPFANFHPSQFLLGGINGKRGRSAVCEYLRRELPNLPADYVFVQCDVRDFFGTISTTWIEDHLRLPEAVIRRQVHSGEMLLRVVGRSRAYLTGGENNERVRRVLPQGSALSSLVAEMAMAEVLRGLADHLTSALVITYSDNLGIFMPTAEAAVIKDYLRMAFALSGVGPFDLSLSQAVPITREFKFLGHHWRVVNGELCTSVPERLAEARAMVLRGQMAECLSRTGLTTIRQRIRAQANEWKFWPGVQCWEAELMARWVNASEALEADANRLLLAA